MKRFFRYVSLILIISLAVNIVNPYTVTAANNHNTINVVYGKSVEDLKKGETIEDILGSTITCLGECDKNSNAETYNGYGTIQYELNAPVLNVNNITSEFNSISAQFGKALDIQMRAYLNNTSGSDKVSFEEGTGTNGIDSYVVFDLSEYSFYVEDDIILMVLDAISTYTSLCTLYTSIKYSYSPEGSKQRIQKLHIACTENAGTIRERVDEYEEAVRNLIKLPLEEELNDVEKILYVHDRIVSIGNYVDSGDAVCHTPAAILVEKEGVCQSYANAFNHALIMLGFDAIMVCSASHSWNAVRLNGQWYYIDVTWADPVGTDIRSYASHEYMFVNESAFTREHVLDDKYSNVYGTILDNFGTEYNSFFPKANKIVRSMWYDEGYWYYVHNGRMYRWNSAANTDVQVQSVQYSKNLCVVEVQGVVYYSNSAGIYSYENGQSERVKSGVISDMYIDGNSIMYVSGNSTYSYMPENVVNTPTANPTASPTLKPTASPMPTAEPTKVPTASPTPKSTASPTLTAEPTKTPTVSPTASPTAEATKLPALSPTATPVTQATVDPTENPTGIPTAEPEVIPTASPTMPPTEAPVKQPTAEPTEAPAVTLTEAPASPVPETAMLPSENQPAPELSKVKIKKYSNLKGKKISVLVAKVKNATGYELAIQDKPSVSKPKYKRYKRTNMTVSGLKKGKTYYFRVRAYIMLEGKRSYGSWSKKMKLKIKR